MNGEFIRGEVYWVCLDDSVGSEEKTGRPAVVVSSNGLNEKQNTIVVAFLTTGSFATATRPSVVGTDGIKRRVLCDQIRTVDKSRLIRYDSKLDNSELIRVTGALASAMSIPIAPPKQESSTLEQNGEIAELKAELDMWKRMYTLTMDRLVELRVNTEITEREKNKEAEYKIPEAPPIEADLREPNFGYKEESEPEKEESVAPVHLGEQDSPVEPEIEFTPGIVNVNTASAKEISEKTGLSLRDAYSITGYRNKNGLFVELEELLEVSRMSKPKFERFKACFTLEEPEPEALTEDDEEFEEEVAVKKVNVNQANIYELMRAGFGKSEAARIVRWVNRYGEFTNLDDLTKVDGVTGKLLRKIRDGLEV